MFLRKLVSRTALRFRAVRSFSSGQDFKLPDLTYDYGELEPFISGEIMELHHSKHHQTYVTNLNNALDAYSDAEAKGDVAGMIALQGAINFNGGGHVNHSIFWQNLAPPSQGGGGAPEGRLGELIDSRWGSFDNFKGIMAASTVAVQGSGWGWLVWDPKESQLEIVTKPNQDPITAEGTPLLGIDVWEHAYYLQYKNVRPDYINELWNVVNWSDVAGRLPSEE